MTHVTTEPRTTRLLPLQHLRLHLRMEGLTAHPPRRRRQQRRTVARWKRHILDSRRRQGGAVVRRMGPGTKKERQVHEKVEQSALGAVWCGYVRLGAMEPLMAHVICGLTIHHLNFSHKAFFRGPPSVTSDNSIPPRSSDDVPCLIYL